MSRTILSRLGAGVVATALVAGGSLLVAAPASAVNDVVTPNSVVENTWGADGGVTVSGVFGAEGDTVTVDIVDSNVLSPATLSYLDDDAVTTTTAGAGGAYSITFAYSDIVGEPNDFAATPALGETPYALVFNLESDAAPVLLPITVAAFAPATADTTIVPACIGADAAASVGVSATGTGFGQYEEGVLVSVTDANGVNFGTNETFDADSTGSITVTSKLSTNLGLIPDGNYTIAFSSVATGLVTSDTFKVGDCTVPTPVAPVVPAAVVPAAPQLANTGSSDAGILVGGSALLLLVGAALVVARRRQNAAA
jgi:LPXTG-motif cell wall-anchored protein